MIRIGMLGKWHVHATDYQKQVEESGKAVITAVWDDAEARGQAWADELGVAFEADLDRFLAREDIDAVICDTMTTIHEEVLVKAAKAGKHIFTEKVLATTVEGCETIASAIRENNVTFCISFPQLSFPDVQAAHELVASGNLGSVASLRMRNAHAGLVQGWLPDYWMNEDEAGGGALMDLGAHPVYLANSLLGKPVRVSAVMGKPLGSQTDEVATVLVEYEGGKAAVLETSLISWNSPRLLELYGTEGAFVSLNDKVTVNLKSDDRSEYKELDLPVPATMPIHHFLDAVAGDSEVPGAYGLDAATDLTRIVVAAYESVANGSFVEL